MNSTNPIVIWDLFSFQVWRHDFFSFRPKPKRMVLQMVDGETCYKCPRVTVKISIESFEVQGIPNKNWVVATQIFFNVHPYLRKIPILANIFQMGWNHQLVTRKHWWDILREIKWTSAEHYHWDDSDTSSFVPEKVIVLIMTYASISSTLGVHIKQTTIHRGSNIRSLSGLPWPLLLLPSWNT